MIALPPSNDSQPGDAPTTVLVTGGAGFVGAATVRALLGRPGTNDLRIHVIDDLSAGDRSRLPNDPRVVLDVADVTAPGVLPAVLQNGGPYDVALHLAGRVGVRRVLADPDDCRRVTEQAADAWTTALTSIPADRRPRLISASTSEVYSDVEGLLAEDAPLRSVDGQGRWAYAGSRVAAEYRFDAIQDLWPEGRGPVHLRFFNVTGPGQDADSGMVLPTFIERARAAEQLPVHGDGSQVRTLAHVDDVAEDLADLIRREAWVEGGALNLGGTARTTVLDLARICIRVAGLSDDIIQFVDPCEGLPNFEEVRWREPDLTRARNFGLARRTRSLEAIVRDAWERHPSARSLAR